MTIQNLMKTAEKLEQTISGASGADRLELQPEFCRLMDQLEAEGAEVPPKLRNLEAALLDEAIEAQFDNLPL